MNYVADSSCADSVTSVAVSSSNAITSSGNNYYIIIEVNRADHSKCNGLTSKKNVLPLERMYV